MREILFRGKKENGEWVYGDLIQLHKEAPYWYILPEGVSSEMYEDEPYPFRQNDVMCRVALAKVIRETIGQFTGLTDKNGKRIFEGDIVKTHKFNTPNKKYIIKFDLLLGAFIGESVDDMYFTTFDGDSDQFEVIGNVHDNKELLE